MMAKPVWWDYILWDHSDPSFPMVVGFKEGTPQEIIDAYFEDQEELEEMSNRGVYHCDSCGYEFDAILIGFGFLSEPDNLSIRKKVLEGNLGRGPREFWNWVGCLLLYVSLEY